MEDSPFALDRRSPASVGVEIKEKEEKYPRVNVRLTGDLGSAFDDIQSITKASSPSEIVRRAIIVYHTLVTQKMKGNFSYIEVIDEGKTKKVPIFL